MKLFFPYKNPENYYHFLIFMISNLRHIDYEVIDEIYLEYITNTPELLKNNPYILEILSYFFPNMQGCFLGEKPLDAIYLEYNPSTELSRGDPYSAESYIFLRNKLMPHIEQYKLPKIYDKIYISRDRASKRKIINEIFFQEYLQSNGFHILYLEDLTAIEQMAYFYHASVIISPHGAGLTNILFCNENVKIIEIATQYMTELKHFSHIAEVLNLKYSRYTNVSCYTTDVDSNMLINFSGLDFSI